MGIGDWIDGAIAPIAPGWAAQRISARARLEASRIGYAGLRRYDAAAHDRRTSGWSRTPGTADSENAAARSLLSCAGHDLVRNNKYAAAGVRQMIATIWGDGIAAQAVHPVKRVQKAAQDEIDRFCEGKVDELGDWYGHGKLAVREMIVGGEAITVWQADADGPDGKVVGMEGAQLDMSKTLRLERGKIVQGVQFNGSGDRTGYWLFDENPNDVLFGSSLVGRLIPADYVDHLYERTRFRQTRGVSWLGAVAMTLHDVQDIEDAKRLQAKVQACLTLVIQPGEGADSSPLGEQKVLDGERGGSSIGETMRPGMIARLRQGETATVVNPSPSADQVEFIRQQIAAVAANMVPYHLMTGDVSQANYSSLRAAMNGSYSMVDDWQQNEVIPLLCKGMTRRRMRRLALERRDPRFLQVSFNYALPVRRMVDPIKDLAGEVMEMRAGLKLIKKGLGERGINAEEHMRAIADMNKVIDDLGLALETDPRRLTDSGILQAAAGYLRPGGSAAANGNQGN
jgi:lambda family phage portal protein